MNKSDINNLTFFITRTEMFIGEESYDKILSFVMGYQLGTNCSFDEFSSFMTEKQKYSQDSLSWWGQIQKYSDDNNINWNICFKKLMLEYFYSINSFNLKMKFTKVHKSSIDGMINGIRQNWSPFDFKYFRNRWNALIIDNQNFKNIFNSTELKAVLMIDNELKKEKGQEIIEKLVIIKNEYKK